MNGRQFIGPAQRRGGVAAGGAGTAAGDAGDWILDSRVPEATADFVAAFGKGLSEAG